MDEYTFLVLAKLKADQLKLRREAAERSEVDEYESREVDARRRQSSHWFTKQDWRLQS